LFSTSLNAALHFGVETWLFDDFDFGWKVNSKEERRCLIRATFIISRILAVTTGNDGSHLLCSRTIPTGRYLYFALTQAEDCSLFPAWYSSNTV
jgi:hypothetical protein